MKPYYGDSLTVLREQVGVTLQTNLNVDPLAAPDQIRGVALSDLPKFILTNYAVHEWRHASAVLRTDFRGEWDDIISVLTDFRRRQRAIRLQGKRLACQIFEELDSEMSVRYDRLMTTVIIEVSGGVVQEVYSDCKEMRVIKVDWDAGESPGDAATGGALFVQPLARLPHDTEKALESLML